MTQNDYLLDVDYLHYYNDVDYFLYDPKTSTSTTSTTERLLLPLLPPRPEVPLFPASNPKITSFHTCAPKP